MLLNELGETGIKQSVVEVPFHFSELIRWLSLFILQVCSMVH